MRHPQRGVAALERRELIVGVNVTVNSRGKFTPLPPLPTSINDHHCFYCGHELNFIHMDHVIPQSRNGSHGRKNRVPSCPDCNTKKSDLTLEEYKALCRTPFLPRVIFHGEQP